MLQMVTAQVQAMFASTGDEPFNVALATDTARKAVSATGDQSISPAQSAQVDQAAQGGRAVARPGTSLVAPGISTHAWSRAGVVVEATMPTWRSLVEPVAEGVGRAISGAMRTQIEQMGEGALPEGILPAGMDPKALLGEMEPLLARMSGSMFGLQVGQAVGALAQETVSGTEMGLPLVGDQAVALLPANVAAFAEVLEVDLEQVRLYLAVREAARVRLFSDVPWLGPQLLAAVRDYPATSRSTPSARVRPPAGRPDRRRGAPGVAAGPAVPAPTRARPAGGPGPARDLPRPGRGLGRRRDRAGHPRAPAADGRPRRGRAAPPRDRRAGREGVRRPGRPRAAPTPAARNAANLFAASRPGTARGPGRAWGHPDIAPTAADLDDPLGYVERVGAPSGDDVDAALNQILREGDAGGDGR